MKVCCSLLTYVDFVCRLCDQNKVGPSKLLELSKIISALNKTKLIFPFLIFSLIESFWLKFLVMLYYNRFEIQPRFGAIFLSTNYVYWNSFYWIFYILFGFFSFEISFKNLFKHLVSFLFVKFNRISQFFPFV